MRILARYMLSASDLTHFPSPTVPEIAFLGRSNVGKSSVINALVGAKLARTSNTPGRTRSINFYEVRRAGQPRTEMLFADLPGYGYAKISREISDDWARFVDPYLHQRPSLALCLALVDSNIPPQQSDGSVAGISGFPGTAPRHRGDEMRPAVGQPVAAGDASARASLWRNADGGVFSKDWRRQR